MPTLASDLIAVTKAHLLSGAKQEMNRLNGSITNSATTATLEFDMGTIAKGTVLAMELELLYVWSVSGFVATVQRGYLGSVAASHADDVLVTVNPRWSDFSILAAINDELASFSSPVNGLYRIRTVDITYSAARSGYNLTSVTDLIDVLAVEAKGSLVGDRHRIRSWRLLRDQDTADFASGLALYLYDAPAPGKVIRVTYKAPFVALATLADNVQTVSFLPATANDIPPLGAAARIMATRESRRAVIDTAPEPRQAQDVPPGAALGAGRALMELRRTRLREEAIRLHQAYPRIDRSA